MKSGPFLGFSIVSKCVTLEHFCQEPGTTYVGCEATESRSLSAWDFLNAEDRLPPPDCENVSILNMHLPQVDTSKQLVDRARLASTTHASAMYARQLAAIKHANNGKKRKKKRFF
jgi:hypothetical protein